MAQKKEIWKDVPGFEGYYQASNLGRVRSLDRHVFYKDGREVVFKGKLINGSINNGYRCVGLSKKNKSRTFMFHQLVAMAFLNHKPNGVKMVVDHINGDKMDNRVDNLRIVTQRENLSTCHRVDSKTLSSKYTGVSFVPKNSKWSSAISYNKNNVKLGIFDNEIEAHYAYQSALLRINDGSFNPADYKPKWRSKYKCVSFHKGNKKWRIQATINGKRKHLGYFKTELEAHNAYQKALNNQM